VRPSWTPPAGIGTPLASTRARKKVSGASTLGVQAVAGRVSRRRCLSFYLKWRVI